MIQSLKKNRSGLEQSVSPVASPWCQPAERRARVVKTRFTAFGLQYKNYVLNNACCSHSGEVRLLAKRRVSVQSSVSPRASAACLRFFFKPVRKRWSSTICHNVSRVELTWFPRPQPMRSTIQKTDSTRTQLRSQAP